MRRWLDPVERREIQKALSKTFELIGTYPTFHFQSFSSQVRLKHLLNSTRLMMNTLEWQDFERLGINIVCQTNNTISFIHTFLMIAASREEFYASLSSLFHTKKSNNRTKHRHT